MKTLYLHIGTPKTATSSIQALCRTNRKRLHGYGYSFPFPPFDYPRVGRGRNAHFLIAASTDHELTEEQEDFYAQRLNSGLDMIHSEFSFCDNVILSEESLWRAINYTKWNPLEILKKDAAEHGYTIKVIVYLRRQDGYLLSNWNQLVKKLGLTESSSDHTNRVINDYPLLMNYASALDRIAAIIGKESMTVRRFEPDSWIGGSIYTDFLDAIGLPDAELKLPEKRLNPGLKDNYFEIKRLVNGTPALTHKERDFFGACAFEASDAFGGKYEYGMLSKDEISSLLEYCREENDRVATEYIGDGKPLFSDEIKDLPKYDPHNEYMDEDIIHFFASVSTGLLRENESLREELRQCQKKVERLADQSKDMKKRLDSQQKAIEANKKETEKLRGMIRHPFRTVLRFIKGKFKKKK
ncbi:MAG: hypothetical protein LUI02_06050 [Clostridiales bacterium]|nr:hypothetical protein [Clostridiales bacterium]